MYNGVGESHTTSAPVKITVVAGSRTKANLTVTAPSS